MTSVPIPDFGTVSDASEHTRPTSGLFPAEGRAGFPPQAPARRAGTPGRVDRAQVTATKNDYFLRSYMRVNAHAAPRGEPWAARLFPRVGAEFVVKVVKRS